MLFLTIIYDQVIVTTRPVGDTCPLIIVKDKITKKALIIDVSCPVDTNIGKKEREKMGKYVGLKVELQRMLGMDTEIVPIIIGGLGAIIKNLGDKLTEILGHPDRFMCQKICLLGSKQILTDVLKRKHHSLMRPSVSSEEPMMNPDLKCWRYSQVFF